MKHETAEWVAKAEADLATARREASVTEHPNFDAVCFHSQQCAEKYLKAILVEHAAKISRIHDLEILVNEVTSHIPQINSVLKFARILSAMAVEVRYPGMNADEDDADEALHSADEIRDASRSILIEKNDTAA
jgi:HEPN domain-containing protein